MTGDPTRRNLTTIVERSALVASRLAQRLEDKTLRTLDAVEAREIATTINLLMDVTAKAQNLLDGAVPAAGMDSDPPSSV